MSFTPAIPLGGFAGYRLLGRTLERQQAALARDPAFADAVARFREAIKDAKGPDDILKDRRVLTVALGAFGLGDEIGKRAIIRRVLEEGASDREAFANRLGDPRLRAFAEEFSFKDRTPPVDSPAFADRIAAQFLERSFEARVGEQDPDLRLALNFRREIAALAASPTVERSGWLRVAADRPLRAVIEAAFGLPATLGRLDPDRQVEAFREGARRLFGDDSLAGFRDPQAVDTALRRFFARRAAESGPSAATPGASALSLLTAGGGALAAGLGAR